jgi:tetratricopeptide (TPR) repeat protein
MKPKANTVKRYTKEELAAIEDHIEAHFGMPQSAFVETEPEGICADVIVIEQSEHRRIVLVTRGMGAHQMNVPANEDDDEDSEPPVNRMELVCALPADWNIAGKDDKDFWPIGELQSMARLPVEEDAWLEWGHTIGCGEIADTGFTSFMLIAPFVDDLDESECALPGGDVVKFYQAIPLYEDELEYKRKNGPWSLLILFRLAFGDQWDGTIDINRKSVIDIVLGERPAAALASVAEEYNYPYIYDDLACFLNTGERRGEGIALLTAAIEASIANDTANPPVASLYAQRGELYRDANQPNEALQDFLRAASDINALEVHYSVEVLFDHIGHLYEIFLNDADKAREFYRRALEHDPNDDYALGRLGNLSRYLRDYKKAIEYYDAAIAIDAEEDTHYLNRALAHKAHAQGAFSEEAASDFNTALAMYRTQIEENPDNACPHAWAGACLLGLAKHEESRAHLEKAIALAPHCEDCPPCFCHEAHFSLCEYYAEKGDPEKAKAHLALALQGANAVEYHQYSLEKNRSEAR